MVQNLGQATVSVLAETAGFTRSLERGLNRAFSGAVGFAATAAIGAVFAKGIASANAFEKNLLRTFQLLPTYSQDSFDQISAQIFDVANDIGVAAGAIADGVYDAVGAGFELPEALKLSEIAAKAATASGSELAVVMDGLTSVINSYGHENLDAQVAADTLFQTFNFGKASIDELAGSLYDVAPVASALGIDFGQVGAAMSVLTASGVKASVATTNLRQAFNELGREGSKGALNFQAVAGRSFPDFIKAGGTVNEAVRIMAQRAKDLDTPLNTLFVSAANGGAGFNILAEQMERAIELEDKFKPENIAGKTDAAFEVAMLGITARMTQARNRWRNTMTEAFTGLKPVTDALQGLFIGALNNLSGFFDRSQGSIAAWAIGAGAAMGPFTEAMERIGTSLLPVLEQSFEKMGATLEGLGGAFMAIWSALEPLFAGVGGMTGLWETFVNVGAALTEVFVALVSTLPAVAQVFAGIGFVAGPVVLALSTLVNAVLPPLISFAGLLVSGLAKAGTAFGALGAGATAAAAALGLAWLWANRFVLQARLMTAASILLSGVMLNLRIAFYALQAAMAANPFLFLATVIIAVGTALVFAYKKSETFRNIVKKSFNAIVSGVGAAVKFLIKIGSMWLLSYLEFFSKILNGLKWVPKWLGGGAIDGAAAAMSNLIGTVRSGVDRINGEIDRIVNKVQVDIVMTLSTTDVSRVGQAQAAANEEQLRKAWDRQAASTRVTSVASTKTTSGGGGGGGLGPLGNDFGGGGGGGGGAGAGAAESAKKALSTLLKAIGTALDKLAKDTGKMTVDTIKSVYSEASTKIKEAIEKAAEAGNKALANNLKAQQKVVQKGQQAMVSLAMKRDKIMGTLFGNKYTLDQAKDLLKDLKKESMDFVTSTKASITALGNLTRDTGGINSTFTGMRNNLRKAVAQTEMFTVAMRKLRDLGLNETAKKQLAEAFLSDPTEALRQAQLLGKSGSKGVGEINKLQGQLDKAGNSLASHLNAQFYEAGISAANGLVSGLQKQHDAIVRQMDRIADAMVKRIKDKLKIKSPSGVFEDEVGIPSGEGVWKGFNRAIASGGPSGASITQNINFGPGAVAVNGVNPAASRRAGIVTGQGIVRQLEENNLAAQIAGVI